MRDCDTVLLQDGGWGQERVSDSPTLLCGLFVLLIGRLPFLWVLKSVGWKVSSPTINYCVSSAVSGGYTHKRSTLVQRTGYWATALHVKASVPPFPTMSGGG